MDIFGPPQSTYLNDTTRVIRTPPAPQGGGVPQRIPTQPQNLLLLYRPQVAAANAKNVLVDANGIRSISYTKEGIPLATQEHGWDVEDIEEADRLAEEEED